ncbi:MAG: hypothetical protein AAF340_14645 [Pseudomonadota bacterium]
MRLEFSEAEEREYLAMMIGFLLERAFADSSEFEHQCMSAGEALSECLNHLDVARNDGWNIHLTMPRDWITNKIHLAKLNELPALVDVLETVLTFEAQYGTVPMDYTTGQKAVFAPDVSDLLCQIGLLSQLGIPSNDFLLIMTNHHFLQPVSGKWDAKIELMLKSLVNRTLNDAPEDYIALIEGRGKHPAKFGEGYLCQHWRYGKWLDQTEQRRAIRTNHPFLPPIVNETIIQNNGEVWVPLGYRIT